MKSEVLTVLFFWDKMLCRPMKVKWRFGGMPAYLLSRSESRTKPARSSCAGRPQYEENCFDCLLLYAAPFLGLFSNTENGDMFFRNVGWISMEHIICITAQKTEFSLKCWVDKKTLLHQWKKYLGEEGSKHLNRFK
jgi:hypothetical protein